MSILIKGIDLPKTKDNRWIIQIYNNGEIYIAEEIWDDTKKGRNKLCRRYIGKGEAIQIDRPHGDLIDRDIVRDECYKTMEELMQSTTINMSAEALSLLCGFTIINNASAIIQGED